MRDQAGRWRHSFERASTVCDGAMSVITACARRVRFALRAVDVDIHRSIRSPVPDRGFEPETQSSARPLEGHGPMRTKENRVKVRQRSQRRTRTRARAVPHRASAAPRHSARAGLRAACPAWRGGGRGREGGGRRWPAREGTRRWPGCRRRPPPCTAAPAASLLTPSLMGRAAPHPVRRACGAWTRRAPHPTTCGGRSCHRTARSSRACRTTSTRAWRSDAARARRV